MLKRILYWVKSSIGRNWQWLTPLGCVVLAAVLTTIGVLVQPNKEPAKIPVTTLKHPLPGKVEHDATDQPAVVTPPAQTPTPAPRPAPVPTPHSVLGLTSWKLALPVDTSHAGEPDEITQPELATFSLSPYFVLTGDKKGVIFQAPAGGATTKNSKYPRSELREMTADGKNPASWSNKTGKGTHRMTVRQAITHLPDVKRELVAAQIHDSSDDVIMIRLNGSVLHVEANDGENIGTLDANYVLGTPYTVGIEASNGHIKVYYNNEFKVDFEKSGSGWYFKAGCYTQSNPSKGDSATAYGEVIIYSLSVSH